MNAAPAAPRRSIVWKLTLFVTALVVLVAGGLSVSGYVVARRIMREQVRDRLTVVAADRQAQVLGFIGQQQERVALVTSRTRLRQVLGEFSSGKLAVEQFRADSRKILLDAQQSAEGVAAIWITDLDGKVITATEDEYLGQDFGPDPDFQLGREERTLGAPHLAGSRLEAYAVAPVSDSDGIKRGVCMLALGMEPMKKLLDEAAGLAQTGEVLLANRSGEGVHFLLPTRRNGVMRDVPASREPALASAIAGRSGFVHFRDDAGREVLAAFRPVGYRDWGLAAKMEVSEADAPVARLGRILGALGAGFLVLVAGGSFFLSKRITRPIRALAASAEAVAAGHLGTRVDVTTHDELGALGHAFNRMTAELAASAARLQRRDEERARTAESIAGVIGKLSTTSRELLATTTSQATGSGEQEIAVAQTVSTVRQVAHIAEESATWAQRVGDAAQKAATIGADGSAAVHEAIGAMGVVEREVGAISGHIRVLVERAKLIAEIIASVNEVARQTNVLAVNASIEASRAGDAGRGFEVVATEIRGLAERSRLATGQIRQILDDIKNATTAAVLGTESGLKAVTGAAEIVARAGGTIESLSEHLSANAQIAQQIMATAKEQATGMAQVDFAMENILRVARQNVTAISQAEAAAQHLQFLSDQLTGLAGEAST